MKKFKIGKTYKRYSSTDKLLYTVKVQNRMELSEGTCIIHYTITKHFTTPNNHKDIINEPIHSTTVAFNTTTSEVLFDSTYHVIIHPAEHDSTSHIKYRQYLYKVCTNKDYFLSELHNIKKYEKYHDIRHLLLSLVLITCDTIVKFNFSEFTSRDALSIVVRGLRAILEELIVTENIYTNYDFLDMYSLNNIPEMHTSLIFIDTCVMYSRYSKKFDPLLNKIIKKALVEYRDH